VSVLLAAKRTKDLGEKIQSYEQKAEKLVMLAVERPDQLNETEKKMKKLINKIKADQVTDLVPRSIVSARELDTNLILCAYRKR
jgi:hypothetical protein